jgi:hypothetical protein
LLAFAGGATLPAGGAILALAAWPAVLRPDALPRLFRLHAVLVLSIVALGTLGMVDASILPTQPQANGPLAVALLVIGVSLLGAVAWRALRTPDGLASQQLDLDVRILTACDVYDALISNRVYRDAWSPAQALRTLKTEEGSAFDGRCVATLEQVISGRPAHDPGPYRVAAAQRVRMSHGQA